MNASTGEDDDDGNDGDNEAGNDDGESNEKEESIESILKYFYSLNKSRDREIMIKSILNLSIIIIIIIKI
jgi:hypothetical protein